MFIFQFFNDKIYNVFFDIIVSFIVQKLKNKHLLQKYTNWESWGTSHFDRTRGDKNQIFPASEDTEPKPEEPIPQKNNERRLSGFSRLSSYTPAMSIAKSSLSSDSNSDSPKTVKKFQKAYAGKKVIKEY